MTERDDSAREAILALVVNVCLAIERHGLSCDQARRLADQLEALGFDADAGDIRRSLATLARDAAGPRPIPSPARSTGSAWGVARKAVTNG